MRWPFSILLGCFFLTSACTHSAITAIPAPPAFKGSSVWNAERTSAALGKLQDESPGLVVAPLQDKNYAVLTDESVLGFIRYWKEFSTQLRNELPESEASNCNNYAAAMRLMANFAAMKSGLAEPIVASVIVFHRRPFGGLPPTQENHDVVFFMTESGWWVAEPQSGFIDRLSAYPNRDHLLFLSLH